MPFATTALIAGGLAAAGSVGSSLIGASAAGKAASTQAQAANYAANLQTQQAQNALQYNQGQYANSLGMELPWLQGGTAGLANLEYLLGMPVQGNFQMPTVPGVGGLGPNAPNWPGGSSSTALGWPQNRVPQAAATSGGMPQPGSSTGGSIPLSSMVNTNLGMAGSLLQPWTQAFKAPTAAEAAQTPGYQFQQAEGQKAIQRSAAASGDLLSGGTMKALDQYSQGLASTNYQQTYNNAFNQYATSYNQFENNQANTYNRLAAMAGLGQVTAGQLGTLGQSSAGANANISLTAGGQIGNSLQNAAAARATGYYGTANALSGGLNNLSQLAMLYNWGGNRGGGGSWMTPSMGQQYSDLYSEVPYGG